MSELTLQDYRDLILNWANERNIIQGSTAEDQIDKLFEEVGELVKGMNKGNIHLIKDAIGDCFVCLVNIAGTALPKRLGDDAFNDRDTAGILVDTSFKRLSLFIWDMYCSELREKKNSLAGNIGLFYKTLYFIAKNHNLTLLDCVASAWNEIKDRRGKMVGGKFVKEEDLQQS